ncbi:MAG: hypothetical protein LPK88_13600 [Alphaproteobacteria bacterium]|nr:hypothetical protein [Alphaproteobacteria bacterium]MDX5417337.1 hypothetical protein [Alphaproteobacteria bacterium]MDX5494793.1 hypothetical protein [Alphaproteobacteria bacterium]
MIRRLAALFAPLLLAGCLVSDGDLIAPAEADYPVADGSRFTVHMLDETGARADETPERAIVTIGNGRYMMRSGEENKVFGGLMKEVGPNLFAVMIREEDQTEGNLYALMERDGASWKRWGMVCPDFVSLAESEGVKLAQFGMTVRNSDCVVDSFANLKMALLFAYERQKPDAEYVPE